VEQVLAYGLQIADALAHAHARGLVHRDLKPENVMVTPEGRIKILDFGLAVVGVQHDASARDATLTHALTIQGTVPYMSPEQLAGDPAHIDARCDVYALGVIGYELLAGRPPFDVGSRPLPEALRFIEHAEPTSLGHHNRALRGDLQTIIEHAMEKDPARRYASAAALANDIERYLDDQAITARPASALYQLRKFARRNRMLVGGVAATMLALAAGVIATSWQWRNAALQRNAAAIQGDRAHQQRDLALGLLGHMTEFVEFSLADLPGATKARLSLARETVEGMERAARGAPEDDPIHGRLAYAHQRLGEALLIAGPTTEAIEHFQRSAEIRERMPEFAPGSLSALRQVGVGCWKVAEAQMLLGRTDQALANNRRALEIFQDIAPRDTASGGEQRLTAYLGPAHRRVAESLAQGGDDLAAIQHFRSAIDAYRAEMARDPASLTQRRGIVMALRALAEVLLRQRSDESDAEPRLLLDEAWRMLAGMLDEVASANLFERSEQARVLLAHSRCGREAPAGLPGTGDSAPGALPGTLGLGARTPMDDLDQALRIAGALAEADEANIEVRELLAAVRLARGRVLHAAGEVAQAREALTAAAEDLARLRQLDPQRAVLESDERAAREALELLPPARS